ncbi:MAG: hypothetical protein IJ228_06745 [Succinivibrio sp.]|nr:hypothetical protein [Succinivibrio sp.]
MKEPSFPLHLSLQEMDRVATALFMKSEDAASKKCRALMSKDNEAFKYHEEKEYEFFNLCLKVNARLAEIKDKLRPSND